MSDDKTALTSELSLFCNDRHSEKINFRIFSGNDETLFKTKSQKCSNDIDVSVGNNNKLYVGWRHGVLLMRKFKSTKWYIAARWDRLVLGWVTAYGQVSK